MEFGYGLHLSDKQDVLFRSLYLRREFQLISTIAAKYDPSWTSESGTSAPTARSTTTHQEENGKPDDPSSSLAPARIGAFHVIARELLDVILLPSANSTVARGSLDNPDGDLLDSGEGWPGLVCVLTPSSPWFQGYFDFTVHFPPRYPFEAPTIHLSRPLRSHPLLLNDVEIPFEEVYCSIDPMRVSVMASLLLHIRRFFTPAEWPASWRQSAAPPSPTTAPAGAARLLAREAAEPAGAVVNRVLARQDVERCSFLQEIVLSKPYARLLGANVLEHFLGVLRGAGGGAARAPDILSAAESREWSAWYTREFLPRTMKLP